jgi:hypothetical protein
VKGIFNVPSSPEVACAINYYLTKPPKKQVVLNGNLDWEESKPDHKNQAELILRLVCRVRNNLFHGGKFNNRWFEPQRSEELLSNGLVILRAAIAANEKVRDAYAQKVD